jgi:hypothetical protein
MEPDLVDDQRVYPILLELLACLKAELGAQQVKDMCFVNLLVGTEVPAEFVHMNPTDTVGAAYVRLGSAYPSVQNFPEPDPTPTCSTALAFPIAVGILRCASIGDDTGNPPDQDEYARIVRRSTADMALMRRVIQCCLADKFDDSTYVLGTWEPLPNLGGVVGGEFSFIIQEPI